MNEISRVFAPLLFKFLRLPKFPQFKFSEFKHDAHMNLALPELRTWQLIPTKQESRPEIQAQGKMKGDAI